MSVYQWVGREVDSDGGQIVRDVVEYDDATDQTDVVLHRTLSAFGEITSETGAADTPFGFTGRIFEEYTSLQDNWRRW